MRKIFAIAWKDTLVRFSSRSELLFFIILPVVFTFVLSGAITKLSQGDNRLPVLVADQDNTPLSAELLTALGQSDAIRVVKAGPEKAEAEFAKGETPAWLTIPAGFSASLLAGRPVALPVRTLANSLDGLAAERAVQSAASEVSGALGAAGSSTAEAERIRPFASAAERQAYFDESLAAARSALAAALSRVQVTQPPVPTVRFSGNVQASAGQLITWVLVPLLATSALFAYERATGTLRRILTTPVSKAVYLLGTLTGQLAAGLVQMALLVGFGTLALGLHWGQSPLGLALVLFAFGLAAVSLGTLLGTLVRSESQANGLSIMLGMTLALLGGCWYPLELFPQAARSAAQLLPTTWAMQGLTDLVLRGQGLGAVLPEAGVLMGFAAVFFFLGVARFKYE
jgi:linearmycin/streptolysin S transport system permease protein